MIKRLLTSLSALSVVMSLSLSPADAFGASKDAKKRSIDVCKTYKGKYDPNLGMSVAEWNAAKAKLMPFCDGTTFHCTSHRKGGLFGMVKGVCDSPDLCKDPVIRDACEQHCVLNRRQDQKSEAIKKKLEICPVKPITAPKEASIPPAHQPIVPSSGPAPYSAPQANVVPANPAVEAEPVVGRNRANTYGNLKPLPKVDDSVNPGRYSMPVNPAEISDSEKRMMEEAAMVQAQEEAMKKAEMDRKMAEEIQMHEEMMRHEEEMLKAQEAANLSIPSAPLPAPLAPESMPAPSFLDDSIPLPPAPPAPPPAPPALPSAKKNPLASSAPIEGVPAMGHEELRRSAPVSSGRGDLLAEIQKGKALKSVSPEEIARLEQEKKQAVVQDDSNPLAAIQKAMEARRPAFEMDNDDDNDDDNDWD